MLRYFGTKFRSILLKQGIVRGIDGEGNLAALGKKAHLNRPVDQLVSDGYLVFSFAIVAFQQRFPIFIYPRESYNRALPVEIHLHCRVDGQIDG